MTAYNVIGATTMVGGQPEDVSQVLTNFQAIAAVINGGLDDSNIAPNANIQASKIAGLPSLSGSVPVGTILQFAAPAPPSGFLSCDGSAVSRSTYSQLFAVIGVAYGAGDGGTTFNVPDFRGRGPVGYAASGGHADVAALGLNEGIALASRRPRHGHSSALTTSHNLSLPNHGHGFSDPGHAHPIIASNDGATSGNGYLVGSDHSPAMTVAAGNGSQTAYTGASVGGITSAPGINGGVTLGGSIGVAGPTDSQGYLTVNYVIRYQP